MFQKNLTEIKLFALFVAVYCCFAWKVGMYDDGMLYVALAKNLSTNILSFPALHLSDNLFPKFWEHPPFIIGLQALIFKIFPVNWATARLGGYLWVFCTMLLLFSHVKKTKGEHQALLSTLLLLFTYPLIKNSQFPNMDQPLMFFYLLGYVQYSNFLLSRQKIYWFYLGLAFGGALLCKGHPALFLPLAVGIHLLVAKEFRTIRSGLPFLSLIVGLLIFAIWPLLLYSTGEISGFKIWFTKQFLSTVINARGSSGSNHYFLYIVSLAKNFVPAFFVILFGAVLVVKKRRKIGKEELKHLVFILAILLPLSCVKWKYSHYLLPVYPFLALLAGEILHPYIRKPLLKKFILVCTLLVFIINIFLPPKIESSRGKLVFDSINILNRINSKDIQTLAVSKNVTTAWTFISKVVFLTSLEAKVVDTNECQLNDNVAYIYSRQLIEQCGFSKNHYDQLAYLDADYRLITKVSNSVK